VSTRTRAVLFDAGHTLLEFDAPRFTAVLRERGHPVSRAAVTDDERRARARLDAELAAQPTRERKGTGRYLHYLLANLGIDDDAERAAVAEWRRSFNVPIGMCHQADPQAADALRRLRDAGLVTGVISNSNGSVRAALERAGLIALLDFVIDSTVVGIAKPDPRIFELGVKEANVRASEAVYVGDSYHVDVVGSRAAGMTAVLFDPGGICGARDCMTAPGLSAAADLALGV
jgi:putative hydrolase of the HAD superfamily